MRTVKVQRKTKDAPMKAEYDFANMKGGVRGKYVRQYQEGTNLVLLEPEIAAAFPTSESVNKALRAVLQLTSGIAPKKQRAR